MAARQAADADVRAEPLDTPLRAAARVRLAEREPLAEVKLYGHGLPIRSSSALMALRRRSASARAASAKSVPFDA